MLDDLSRLLTNFFMNQTLLKLPKKLVQHQTIKLSDHLIELFGGLNMWWGIQQCMLESLQFIIYMYWHQYFLLDVLTVYTMILYITYQILKFFFFLCFFSDSSRVITLDLSKAKKKTKKMIYTGYFLFLLIYHCFHLLCLITK